jgi:hypothetical protein
LREGVVEAAEGVAYEGAGWFGEEFVLGSHVEYYGGGWVGDVWFAKYCDDELKYKVPVRFDFVTLNDV